MALSLLLASLSATTALSASILQSAQGDGGKDSLSMYSTPDDSSMEPDPSMIVESIGSSQSANASYQFPNAIISGSIYDMPFQYPELDLEASDADIQCKESFGVNLSRASCDDIIRGWNPKDGSEPYSWGQRGKGNFHANLPYRFSSSECPPIILPNTFLLQRHREVPHNEILIWYGVGDGFCVIDVVHAKDAVSDMASSNEIKQAARQLINGCVKNGAPNTGGLIRNIGMWRAIEPSPDAYVGMLILTQVRIVIWSLLSGCITRWSSAAWDRYQPG